MTDKNEVRQAPIEPVAWAVVGADGKLLISENKTLLSYFDNPPRPLVWGDVGSGDSAS